MISPVERNKNYLEGCIEIARDLKDTGNLQECARYIKKISHFAWRNFSGYYCSNEIETLLEQLGSDFLQTYTHPPFTDKNPGSKKILHIASEVYKTGGHTKLLFNWIKLDSQSIHYLYCTRMGRSEILTIAEEYNTSISPDNIRGCAGSEIIDRLDNLFNVLKDQYDFIVLHIHPDDILPNMVLPRFKNLPPVLFLNHADHTFWLGRNILDYLIQIREINISIDSERRQIPSERQFLLPIPITLPDINAVKKEKHTVDILTTGSAYKFRPNTQYNFFEEASRIVNMHENAIIHLVGVSSDTEFAKKYTHPRIIFHGIQSPAELAEIENNADIYLEGFPMPSFTALLQSAAKKIPFQLHYKPLPIFQLFTEKDSHATVYPDTVEKWRENVDRLIADVSWRQDVQHRQYQHLEDIYREETWIKNLALIYRSAVKLNKDLPHQNCNYYNGENENLLVTIDRAVISHTAYTKSLGWWRKIKYLRLYKLTQNRNVQLFPSHCQSFTAKLKFIFRYIFSGVYAE